MRLSVCPTSWSFGVFPGNTGRPAIAPTSTLLATKRPSHGGVWWWCQERGEDSLVNTTVEGSTLIVHGTYPYLVIRHGDNVVGLRRNTVQ